MPSRADSITRYYEIRVERYRALDRSNPAFAARMLAYGIQRTDGTHRLWRGIRIGGRPTPRRVCLTGNVS